MLGRSELRLTDATISACALHEVHEVGDARDEEGAGIHIGLPVLFLETVLELADIEREEFVLVREMLVERRPRTWACSQSSATVISSKRFFERRFPNAAMSAA